jgi:hypothetical protein
LERLKGTPTRRWVSEADERAFFLGGEPREETQGSLTFHSEIQQYLGTMLLLKSELRNGDAGILSAMIFYILSGSSRKRGGKGGENEHHPGSP